MGAIHRGGNRRGSNDTLGQHNSNVSSAHLKGSERSGLSNEFKKETPDSSFGNIPPSLIPPTILKNTHFETHHKLNLQGLSSSLCEQLKIVIIQPDLKRDNTRNAVNCFEKQ